MKSKITYNDPESNIWKKARVMSTAGKVSGENKYYFNVKDLNDDSKCRFWEYKWLEKYGWRSWKDLKLLKPNSRARKLEKQQSILRIRTWKSK